MIPAPSEAARGVISAGRSSATVLAEQMTRVRSGGRVGGQNTRLAADLRRGRRRWPEF